MDEDLIRRIQVAAHSVDASLERIRDLIAELPTPSATHPGQKFDGDVVVIEKEKLAELLAAVARPPSFYDALLAEGFRPATGVQPQLRRGHPRIPLELKRYGAD
jgi:hypothetical protein